MAKPDPKAYWPLVRFLDDDFKDDPAADTIMLTDSEMIMVRVALRMICQQLPANEPLGRVLESAREKIENCLDLEFNEGRFAGNPEVISGG